MTQRQSQVKVLPIHIFAQLCLTTSRTIRFYDKIGLLRPKYIDPATNYRYYTPLQARDFFKIKLLQLFRVNLKNMKTALKKHTEETFLEDRLRVVEAEIEEKQKKLKFLRGINEFLFDRKNTPRLTMEEYGPYILLCTLLKNARYDRINMEIDKLRNLAREIDIATKQPIVFYHLPYDYKPTDTEIEICLICNIRKIPTNITLPKNYYFKKYHMEKALTYTYRGPYEYLTFIHLRILDFVKGKRLNDYPFDLYIRGPWDKANQFDHVTKIGYPFK